MFHETFLLWVFFSHVDDDGEDHGDGDGDDDGDDDIYIMMKCMYVVTFLLILWGKLFWKGAKLFWQAEGWLLPSDDNDDDDGDDDKNQRRRKDGRHRFDDPSKQRHIRE